MVLCHLTEVNEFLVLLVELNNKMHQSPSLEAPFWSRKVHISSAYNINYYIQTMGSESLVRLTKLCSIDGADGLLGLLVELKDDPLMKGPLKR